MKCKIFKILGLASCFWRSKWLAGLRSKKGHDIYTSVISPECQQALENSSWQMSNLGCSDLRWSRAGKCSPLSSTLTRDFRFQSSHSPHYLFTVILNDRSLFCEQLSLHWALHICLTSNIYSYRCLISIISSKSCHRTTALFLPAELFRTHLAYELLRLTGPIFPLFLFPLLQRVPEPTWPQRGHCFLAVAHYPETQMREPCRKWLRCRTTRYGFTILTKKKFNLRNWNPKYYDYIYDCAKGLCLT